MTCNGVFALWFENFFASVIPTERERDCTRGLVINPAVWQQTHGRVTKKHTHTHTHRWSVAPGCWESERVKSVCVHYMSLSAKWETNIIDASFKYLSQIQIINLKFVMDNMEAVYCKFGDSLHTKDRARQTPEVETKWRRQRHAERELSEWSVRLES